LSRATRRGRRPPGVRLMDTARYVIAVLTVVTVPPAIFYWIIGHPLAAFWRRVGPLVTYSVLLGTMALGCWGIWLLRDPIFAIEFGTNWALVWAAAVAYVAAFAVQFRIRRQLTFKVLIGLPEFAPDRSPGNLMTTGLYARVRHPRYVAVILGVLAAAMFANYLAGYVCLVLSWLGILLVVRLEERELLERFGEPYARYRESVPAFVPRRKAPSTDR